MDIGPGSVPPTTTVMLSAEQHWGSLTTLGRANYPGVARADSPGGMVLSSINCDLARAVSSCIRVWRLYRPAKFG